jgi:AcrR family transcriptional regulator
MPADRITSLVARATDVFIERGYRRTKIADVAEALGVAKGTVYLYVESKEALFDLVLHAADPEGGLPAPLALPWRTPTGATLLRNVRTRLSAISFPALEAALRRRRVDDVAAELAAIVGELYDVVSRYRVAMKLVDRAAATHPELAAVWYTGGREGLLGALSTYLADRVRRGALPPPADLGVAARFVVETVAWWAMHRHWDPHPQALAEPAVRETVCTLVVRALTGR